MPIEFFEPTMAITLSNSSYNGIRDSSSDFIPVGTKMPIKNGNGYWMHRKNYESLNIGAKKACCDFYKFEERDVYNRPGAVDNNDKDDDEYDEENDKQLLKFTIGYCRS